MVSRTRAGGKGNLGSSFDFFPFVPSQQNVTLVSLGFSMRLGTSVTFHKCQLKNKITYISETSGNCVEEPEIGSQTWKSTNENLFITFQSVATFQSQCSWWKEKELRVSFRSPDIYLTCLFKHQNHLSFLKFLVIQGIKMSSEEVEDGSIVLPGPTRSRALKPSVRRLGDSSTQMGTGRVPNHAGSPMAPERHSHSSLHARGKERLGVFTWCPHVFPLTLD